MTHVWIYSQFKKFSQKNQNRFQTFEPPYRKSEYFYGSIINEQKHFNVHCCLWQNLSWRQKLRFVVH